MTALSLYRDDLAAVLRCNGYKVRCSSLRGQRREWWGWAIPCGITCTVYRVEIRVGGTRLSAEVLSDDALEVLAARVASDFWSDRRRVRLNRPHHVAAALAAGHRLPPETMRLAAA